MAKSRPRPPRAIALSLAVRVKGLREKRGWSQERLAEEADLHRTFLAGIESAKLNPSLATLARLATALKVDLKELFD